MKLDLKNLCLQNSVSPRGIIHVGAYDGKDIKLYQTLGISKILLIEANPTVFERLKANISTASVDVQAVNYAISNQNGKVKLYVNSMGQSSSIFPLKHYRDIYPNIQETHQLTVESKTLDTLVQELELSPRDFNILNLDIQGAELLALQGATNLLKYIDAVYTKVNYEELYEGCAIAEKVDEFLAQTGFGMVAVAKPFHPSWGDAFYVRKQVVSMSTLGKNTGLGNQIFQYAFLKIYAQENGLSVETPKWVGQELFGHKDGGISEDLPVVVENNNEIFSGNGEIWKNVDIQGEFLYHTSYYVTQKEYFCSLFQPVAEIEAQVKIAWEKLRSFGKTIIGLHLQLPSDENNNSVVVPSEWYEIWLHGLWETLEEPVLFIASDNLEEIPLVYFSEYNPITVRDLEVEVNLEYLNFFLLSKCDFVAISNTAFAFASCLLNETGKYFFRPHCPTAKLIPFEPWNSLPVFRDVDIDEVGKSISFEATFQQIQSQLQQTCAELENIQSQKDELSQKLVSTESQLQQTCAELENIQSQKDELSQKLVSTESQLQQTCAELENSQSQRDQILGELEQFHSQLQQNEEKAQNAESQLQQTRQELENAQSQKNQLSQELTSAQSELQQNQEKAQNAESQLQQTRQELENIQSEKNQISQELTSAQSELQQNQEKAQNAESQLQQTRQELENAQSEKNQLSQELTSAQSQLQQNQEKAQNAESQLQQTRQELENLQSEKNQLSQELTSAQSQLQQNQEKAQNAESQLQNIKTELDKSHSELHDTREELEITQFQLDEVQAELEQSQSQLSKYQEQLNTYQSQLQQTQIELEKNKLKLENQEKILPNQNITNYATHIKNLAKILAETIPD
ncbi:MAG: FkbM family methyltransferase [Okeania sp. SIO3I5]|uniref:FkbM family methyltransferase n=1 Tax=Okeania sp. SIO3I5 TaxID=2607805 RepID=UPI0013B73595|nr:FkbM family methyltransferase [Okeania sp. SIO3I5]NEQ38769.1 FkbM family methyltransferase [Okeania sp. SIO3I5]